MEKRETFRNELTQLKVEVTSLRERQDALQREKTRLQEEQVSLKTLRETKAEETSSLEARKQAAQVFHEPIKQDVVMARLEEIIGIVVKRAANSDDMQSIISGSISL